FSDPNRNLLLRGSGGGRQQVFRSLLDEDRLTEFPCLIIRVIFGHFGSVLAVPNTGPAENGVRVRDPLRLCLAESVWVRRYKIQRRRTGSTQPINIRFLRILRHI